MEDGLTPILVIADDDAVNREMLRRLLMNDYRVVEAVNGQEVMTALRQQPVSAVLLDLIMPAMDGFGVMEAMRGEPAFAEIPVIVVTSGASEENRRRALELGAAGFFGIPFNPAVVQNAVSGLIEQKRRGQLIAQNRRLLERDAERGQALEAALHDALTGLYNRDTFCRAASELLSSQPEGSYLLTCFDIRCFHEINELYGYDKGDEVLCRIAGHIRRIVENCGGAAAREYGGHFCALVPAAMGSIADTVAARTNEGLRGDGLRVRIQFATGCYAATELTPAVGELLDRARMALRLSLSRPGTPVVYFSGDMLDRMTTERRLVENMDSSLREGRFEVWYQPQYRDESGALVGAEALARWRLSEKELLLPSAFLLLFERCDFIYELDRFIWERVCRDLRQWLDAGLAVTPVTVNVTASDVMREAFFDDLTGMVDRYGIPGGLFGVELSESAFQTDSDRMLPALCRLREYGIRVGAECSGEGNLSAGLTDAPLDILKIDMSRAAERVRALGVFIRTAKSRDIEVIAARVETPEQAAVAHDIKCAAAQGFLYVPPLKRDEFAALLEQRPFRQA